MSIMSKIIENVFSFLFSFMKCHGGFAIFFLILKSKFSEETKCNQNKPYILAYFVSQMHMHFQNQHGMSMLYIYPELLLENVSKQSRIFVYSFSCQTAKTNKTNLFVCVTFCNSSKLACLHSQRLCGREILTFFNPLFSNVKIIAAVPLRSKYTVGVCIVIVVFAYS